MVKKRSRNNGFESWEQRRWEHTRQLTSQATGRQVRQASGRPGEVVTGNSPPKEENIVGEKVLIHCQFQIKSPIMAGFSPPCTAAFGIHDSKLLRNCPSPCKYKQTLAVHHESFQAM